MNAHAHPFGVWPVLVQTEDLHFRIEVLARNRRIDQHQTGKFLSGDSPIRNGRKLSSMFRLVSILALLGCSQVLAQTKYREEPCKTAVIAPLCVHVHGRLTYGNGTPSTRLWQIATHHVFGIYSNQYGFRHDTQTLDNEAPELHFTHPKDMPEQGGWTVYGDFEVCPLERPIQGHMQAACIATATHIVVPKQ